VEAAASEAQITRLLTNRQLSRLELLRLNASRRFTNKSRGEHLIGRGGTSTEFSDFRDYSPGDDVRFVDWNAFARLHRPYIKLFEQEEEMHVAVLLDASESMLFEDKLERAKQLGAAFGVMGLLGTERVSVTAFSGDGIARLRPCTGRASMANVFTFLERVEGGGAVPLEIGVEAFLTRHVGRGAVVLLSDFLTFGDLRGALNRLFTAGLEIFALQVLGPSEIEPDLATDLRLVDSEKRRRHRRALPRAPRGIRPGAQRPVPAAFRPIRLAQRSGPARRRALRPAQAQRMGRVVDGWMDGWMDEWMSG